MTAINWENLETLVEGLNDEQMFEVIEEIGSHINDSLVWKKVLLLAKECLE